MESWGPHPSSDQRRNWICPCVYVLQTTSQNEFFYGGVRTSCKKSALDVQNLLFFLLLIGLIAVAVTMAFVVAPRIYRLVQTVRNSNTVLVKTPAMSVFTRYIQSCMLSKIRSITDWFTSFLGKPTFGWRGKKNSLL